MENIILKCIEIKGEASLQDDILPWILEEVSEYSPKVEENYLHMVTNTMIEQLIYSTWVATNGGLVAIPHLNYVIDRGKVTLSVDDVIYKWAK